MSDEEVVNAAEILWAIEHNDDKVSLRLISEDGTNYVFCYQDGDVFETVCYTKEEIQIYYL